MFSNAVDLTNQGKIDWDELESVLDIALQLPENKRRDFIKRECADNECLKNELLAFLDAIHDSRGFLSRGKEIKESLMMQLSVYNPEKVTHNSLKGKVIGNYRISDLIGYGGMGSVYLAERQDGLYQQKVALKLIRQGMDTPENIARFERERFILAGLNHPNIARLYDGGVSSHGLPYLVMEYVDGIPIDKYCDKHSLSVNERINLFKTICRTVQYAHNNLVIHRDLKPANILVDKQGQVKILDFGIAKLLKTSGDLNLIQTRQSLQIMTPGYAAPEQITSENVTTTTDLYTLGMLSYSLLCGTQPLDLDELSLVEKQNAITKEVPLKPSEKYSRLDEKSQLEIARLRETTPSKLKNDLKNDLDAIILKTLRKEPHARYQVVNNFVEDLQNYQRNLPVQAHEGNLRYHFNKYFKRNYKYITAAAAMLFMACSFSIYHSAKISAERNQAQTEAQKATQVTSLLFDLFEANDPAESAGDTITAKQLLDRGLNRADMLQDQPEIQAQLFSIIGQIHHRLGNYEESRPLLEKTLNLRTDLYGRNHPEVAGSIGHLGRLLSSMGDYHRAESLLSESLGIIQNSSRSQQPEIAAVKNDLAYVKRRQGDYDEAEMLFKSSYEMFRDHYGSDYIHTVNSRSRLGTIYFNKGYHDRAEEIYKEVLEQRERLLGEAHPLVGESKNSLAALHMILGRYAQAEKMFEEALEIRRQALGPSHPKVALTLNNYAINLREQGLFDQSEKVFNEAIAIRSDLFGDDHVSTANSFFSLAELKLMQQKPDSALSLFNHIYPIFREALSDKHSFTARTKMYLGYTHLKLKNYNRAKNHLQKGYEQVKDIHAEQTLERALADHQMGVFHMSAGDSVRADSLISNAGKVIRNLEQTPSIKQTIISGDLDRLNNRKNSIVKNEFQ
ncbi:MAG: serine/threonine-protein kinase [Balneolaceae bacterium]